MEGKDEVALIQVLNTGTGPGSAELAASWSSTFGITDAHVWGDTTLYMDNFAIQVEFAFPNTLVVELDTMEIRFLEAGGPVDAEDVINGVLAEEADPCAE